ncbi:PREDICTED: uncharacterized protein LOC109593207 [Amphimedon queenslandica]|uniref:Fibronectin type-III domain-containing protein n=1 Tax=Amphimedon queenslandica TaxID=400682 RepID=A0AAN0K447_AMPQE|nr:PREDICTED: uncharacterized protein LOC109593207 [Amphimedon queenslandica]|eukprot:XP_019863956.1 PREDICTED: uncharacterized protein LOC109593207 [Amphimedon queenslandica]
MAVQFIKITGLNDKSCYIFGVRAYTNRGPGNWKVIANETLISTQFVTLTLVTTQEVCIGSTNTVAGAVDGISIGLFSVVGLLLISLAISIIIHISCLIKLKSYRVTVNQANKFNVDDIPMQLCEPYSILKSTEAVYEEPDVNENVDDYVT